MSTFCTEKYNLTYTCNYVVNVQDETIWEKFVALKKEEEKNRRVE